MPAIRSAIGRASPGKRTSSTRPTCKLSNAAVRVLTATDRPFGHDPATNARWAHSPVRATSVPAKGRVVPYGRVRNASAAPPREPAVLPAVDGTVKKPAVSVKIGRPHHLTGLPGSGADRASRATVPSGV